LIVIYKIQMNHDAMGKKQTADDAPRVAPVDCVHMSTVAPVGVAYTYGSRHMWIWRFGQCTGIRVRGVENPQGFGIDERRFVIWKRYLSTIFC
jgi:hypothetical protein